MGPRDKREDDNGLADAYRAPYPFTRPTHVAPYPTLPKNAVAASLKPRSPTAFM